eukprot:TRINITY_DN2586_c0_g1_i1.p1 TRINITY_DN2586_c0_g1~~TRINITY_DN2586_c0_g1_i1.p1  ORF type:complete len:877 (-),score=197.89 TRINITY_DN2586_c0_g1_i1:104-2734(-)
MKGKAHKMKGLSNFISDIRNCTSREAEAKRVNKEMANIRTKFKEAKGLDGYQKKKYVCKIIYMFMLGYEIDFGYLEAINLLSSEKYTEKQMGYVGFGLLLNENHDMIPLTIQSLQNDLNSRSDFAQCLALAAIANTGGKEMLEALSRPVQNLLVATVSPPAIRKRAALAFLRLFRTAKTLDIITIDNWFEKLQDILEQNSGNAHLGLVNSMMSLLLELAPYDLKSYQVLYPAAVRILHKIVTNVDVPDIYVYYGVRTPWLQVKLLRFIGFYANVEDEQSRELVNIVLKQILTNADVTKGQTINHKNAPTIVLFEAMDLIIKMGRDKELINQTAALLGKFISAKETNVRYLGLETMANLARISGDFDDSLIKRHQETVLSSLKDADISIRRRALDLLYGICDKSTCNSIVSELLNYLVTSDYAIREELVLKIAIMAEKHAQDYTWYVDVILQLISSAGDYVSDEIWHRVIQIVTNKETVQEYAARAVFKALNHPSCHETTVKVGGYVLGEFGNLIADNEGTRPMDQFYILHSKFPACTPPTRSLLLSTYAKFINLYPEEKELVATIYNLFTVYSTSMDAEVQQRACEYIQLGKFPQHLQTIWDVMPPFPEKQDSDANDAQKTASAKGTAEPVDISMKDFFDRVCIQGSGILYQNEFLQIGVRSTYQQGIGKMMLYFQNVSPSPLQNFTSVATATPALAIQAQTAPNAIEPGQQQTQMLQITCMTEFIEPPKLNFTFSTDASGQSYNLVLSLPVIINKFIEPLNLSSDEFMNSWRQAQAGEWQVIIRNTVTPMINLPYLSKLLQMGLGFGLVMGIDANPNNVVAAGNFISSTKQVVCLLRIETNMEANMYRLTLRTFNQQVTDAIKLTLANHLGTVDK